MTVCLLNAAQMAAWMVVCRISGWIADASSQQFSLSSVAVHEYVLVLQEKKNGPPKPAVILRRLRTLFHVAVLSKVSLRL